MERTLRSSPVSAAVSSSARSLVMTETPSRGTPLLSKSRPDATRMPLSDDNTALKDGAVAVIAAKSQ